MKVLKIAGLIILSFILFISLTIFGLAFSLNQTILNPDFVTSEINRLEIAPLAEALVAQQLPEELPEDLISVFLDTITRLEPRLKEETNTVIYSVYDYLLGKRESPELASVLRSTFLSSDFIIAVIDEIDIAPLVSIAFEEMPAEKLPIPEEAVAQVATGLVEVLSDQEPWIKEQIRNVVDPVADYLVGESESFSVTISIQPLIDNLKDMMREVFLEFPPPPLEGLSPDLIEEEFEEFWAEAGLPAIIEIDETIFGQEMPSPVGAFVADAEIGLGQAREYVGHFQLWYILIIVFMAVLIAGIVLIHRQVKGSTRTLGIVFLASGLVMLVGGLIGKNIAGEQIVQAMHAAPAQLQVWILQFLVNLLAPLQSLSIGFIVGGTALVVVSFVYKSRHATD